MKYLKTYQESIRWTLDEINNPKLLKQCIKLKKYAVQNHYNSPCTMLPFNLKLKKEDTDNHQLEIFYINDEIIIYLSSIDRPESNFKHITELSSENKNIIYNYIIDEDNYIDNLEAKNLGLL